MGSHLGAARASREVEDVEAFGRVRPEAVVAFDGAHDVVGVDTDAFESGRVSHKRIFADSPLYAAIEGVRAVYTVTIDGREHRLDELC